MYKLISSKKDKVRLTMYGWTIVNKLIRSEDTGGSGVVLIPLEEFILE